MSETFRPVVSEVTDLIRKLAEIIGHQEAFEAALTVMDADTRAQLLRELLDE